MQSGILLATGCLGLSYVNQQLLFLFIITPILTGFFFLIEED